MRDQATSFHLGERLQVARERAGLSRRQLALKAGVEFLTLARIEAGDRPTTIATISAIAEVLGVSLDTLILGDRASQGRPDLFAALQAALGEIEKWRHSADYEMPADLQSAELRGWKRAQLDAVRAARAAYEEPRSAGLDYVTAAASKIIHLIATLEAPEHLSLALEARKRAAERSFDAPAATKLTGV